MFLQYRTVRLFCFFFFVVVMRLKYQNVVLMLKLVYLIFSSTITINYIVFN